MSEEDSGSRGVGPGPDSDADLPADVLRFLEHCIDSVEQLRVLLLLHSQAERTWSIPEITAELRSSDASIEKRLAGLYACHVVERPSTGVAGIRFAPGTPEVREVIRSLAAENVRRPYRVIDSIYARPNKALRAFAEAFKFRGEKP